MIHKSEKEIDSHPILKKNEEKDKKIIEKKSIFGFLKKKKKSSTKQEIEKGENFSSDEENYIISKFKKGL